MKPVVESVVAKKIADALKTNYREVTACDWWVCIRGVATNQLILLTNDPLGIDFRPVRLTPNLLRLRKRVVKDLVDNGIIAEDGTWAPTIFEA